MPQTGNQKPGGKTKERGDHSLRPIRTGEIASQEINREKCFNSTKVGKVSSSGRLSLLRSRPAKWPCGETAKPASVIRAQMCI